MDYERRMSQRPGDNFGDLIVLNTARIIIFVFALLGAIDIVFDDNDCTPRYEQSK